MRIPRIYHPDILRPNTSIVLTDYAAKHILQVLRLQVSAQLLVFNGDSGGEYLATISAIDKRSVTVKLGILSPKNIESPLKIHLAQVISRGEKMDFTIQKAVELGVTEITPLLSERCNVKLPPDRFQKKKAHWQAIMINACEQSGRTFIPLLHEPENMNNWVIQNHIGMKLILHPSINNNPLKQNVVPENISLLVGSEGGFTEDEIVWSTSNQFQQLTLGPRILRTETAALAAISVLQAMWGDFN